MQIDSSEEQEKHFEHRISTEFGRRIEASDEQWAKPDEPMRVMDELPGKQSSSTDWDPKYRITECCAKSTKKGPETDKNGEFASTRI
jgi:hypothetical protein